MSSHRPRMRKLALAYEELMPNERAEVDAYLETDPELRAQLARLREIEAMARKPLGAAEMVTSDVELSDIESAQEQVSRQQLLQRVRGTKFAGRSRVRPTAPLRRWTSVAAAAVLVAVFLGTWSSWHAPSSLVVQDLQVISVDARGSVQRSGPTAFSDGDPFALAFRVSEEAGILVYHIDPGGAVALAYPPRATDALPRVRAGGSVQIPPASHDEGWVFSGAGGTETFVVVATTDRDLDLRALDDHVRAEMQSLTDRRARQHQLEELLRAEAGTTSVVEAQHRN